MKSMILSLGTQLLNLGQAPEDDINKVRLIRQVNGLNLFFIFVAGTISLVFLFTPSIPRELWVVQVVATVLYALMLFLNSQKLLRLVSQATIVIFEIQLFIIMFYTGGWSSAALGVIILYPLLAALFEVSISLHLAVGLVQFAAFTAIHFFFPLMDIRLNTLAGLNQIGISVLHIVQYTYIPVMAAVIIGIIFKENLKAREKMHNMIEVITASKKQLEFYSNELKQETQKLRAELNIAKQIQTMVLPAEPELKQIPELDIACFMRPADEVGGDYFDVIRMEDNILIGMGDVTGHGLSSGIVMLMAQTAIRSVAEVYNDDPSRILPILNRILYSNIKRIKEDRSMTLSLISYKKGKFTVAGQHESVVVCRASGKIEIHDTIDAGFYIGLTPELAGKGKSFSFKLNKDDLMFLYSDGVTEAENEKKEQFGIENLCRTIKKYHALPADSVKSSLVKDLYNYMGETEIFDDISFMVVKQK